MIVSTGLPFVEQLTVVLLSRWRGWRGRWRRNPRELSARLTAGSRSKRHTEDVQPAGRDFQDEAKHLLSHPASEDEKTSASIVWHMIRIARSMETRLEFDVHRPQGWTWPGFRIMANIYVLGPQEPGQLADILHVTRPTITTAIARLERDGYALRQPHPTSRSRLLVELTDAGRTAVEQIAEPHHQTELDLVATLSTKERRQLERLLEKLYKAQT